MKKEKKGFISNLFSLITYKKQKHYKEFYIPEVDEGQENDKQKNENVVVKAQPQNEKNEKNNKGLKKPLQVSEAGKEDSNTKNEKLIADDNTISTAIDANIGYIKKKFNSPANKDLIIRELTIGGKYKGFLVFLDGMVDKATINNFILRPLMDVDKFKDAKEDCMLDFILQNVIQTNQASKINKPDEMISEVLSGNTGLYVEGCDYYIFSETKGFEKRGVDAPVTEGVVKGPQQGFNESIRTNITLIRRIIKNSNLTTEFIKVGQTSNTLCAIMYLDGLINPAVVKEVKRRISSLNTDILLSMGMLEQFIEDNPWSIIPTTLSTERPDRTASHIMEGRAAIFMDGTPFSIIVPVTLQSLLHSPEDAALKWQHGTLLRYLRFISLSIATLLPGMYVALTNYHREMIPTDLLIAIAKARENVPFSTIIELLIMEIAFELIREAGIRIPGIIGNTIGIIGALILGQAAVEAKIVSPVLIIIVAVTGLGNFAIPNYTLAFGVRILRFVFILFGAILGFFGIATAIVILGAMLNNMKSFGIPFNASSVPKTRKSFDILTRWPIWMQELRPDYLNVLDVRRQAKISRKWTQEDADPLKEDNNESTK